MKAAIFLLVSYALELVGALILIAIVLSWWE